MGHQECASHWVGHPEKSVALGGARGKCRRFGWGLFCRAGRIGWGTHWGRFGWGMAKRGMLWVGPSRYPPRVPSADPKSASTLYDGVPSHSTTISLRMPFLSISPQTVSLREPELCCCSFFSQRAALRDVTTVLLFFLSAGALPASLAGGRLAALLAKSTDARCSVPPSPARGGQRRRRAPTVSRLIHCLTACLTHAPHPMSSLGDAHTGVLN